MEETQPPKWALRFLRWYCKDEYLTEIEGDLHELFYLRAKHSSRNANIFFIWNVFRSFRLVNLKKSQNNNWTMNLFKNYTKIYFRRFRKETSHYLVNIFGLGLGFTILFYILMFVHDEQNMDKFHSKKDRIYRVVNEVMEEDGKHNYLSIPGPMADALKQEFPAIEETAHFTYTGSQVLAVGDNRLADREWAIVTNSIFNILDIEIIRGDPMKSINGSAGVVLTEDLAMRLFGRVDVVGEVLDESNFENVEVLAIMKEMPRNSSYRFNNLYVVDDYEQWSEGFRNFINSWDRRFAQTLTLFKEGTSPKDITGLKGDFIEKYLPEENREGFDFHFQKFADIHLGSSGIETGGMNPRLSIPYSDRKFVSMIMMMGLLVIFIAALNYVNLSSVQALKRTLEASMRKINGANNKHLVIQLFYETFLTILIAYAVATLLIILFFPYFLQVSKKNFDLSLLYSVELVPFHILTLLTIWVVSAMLPALYYAKLKRSLLILKNAFSGRGDLLRKALVGVQYTLSIFLIIGSLVIYRQLDYVQSKDLGFDKEQLIVLDINSGTARRSFSEIVQGIKSSANVVNASTSSRVPGEWKNIPTAMLSTSLSDQPIEASHYGADQFWLDTYKMELKEGKNFTGAVKTDSLSIIINDATASILELGEPLGVSIWVMNNRDSVKMKVIGVIEDFHYESLYQPIGPVVITSWNNHIRSIDYFTIRYSGNPKETLEHIEAVNATFDPETPAEINFLDDQWNRFYEAEQSRASIILIASVISIIISAFGLFGLINFTVERKTKEIGIRKVMGASFGNITKLVLMDYLVLLIISLVVAAPISWWLFKDWLSDFAYRINLSADLFIIAFMVVLLISFTTVLARIFKIAKSNPVTSIRYE